jgi:hypothetical protein
MQHPLLMVTIAGTAIEQRPSEFRLETEQSNHGVIATLRYPYDDTEQGQVDDPVEVVLSVGENEYLLFTGRIVDIGVNWAYRDLLLSDSFQSLCKVFVTPAYRKEMASVILQDTLDVAGITDTAITCPDVELARFSTDAISAERCIEQMSKALEEYGFLDLRWFFDEGNTFHFGTLSDTGRNEGEVFEFESGDNIFRSGMDYCGKWIEVLPLPIRHSQKIKINDVGLLTVRTAMSISARQSRLKVWYEEPMNDA